MDSLCRVAGDPDAFASIPAVWRPEFVAVRIVPGRALCAVQGFMFTSGLLTRLRFDGLEYHYGARFCFESRADAVRSLLAWDGVGDPPGEWIKEKVTGRSRGDGA